jgi:hypothetical protein
MVSYAISLNYDFFIYDIIQRKIPIYRLKSIGDKNLNSNISQWLSQSYTKENSMLFLDDLQFYSTSTVTSLLQHHYVFGG